MSKPAATARWLTLCVLGILAVFAANYWYSRTVTSQIDRMVGAITQNSAASVIYLSSVTEDIRRVSSRAMLARPETVENDRAEIEPWLAAMDDAIKAYRLTDEYPGEHDLYLRTVDQRPPFLEAVHHTLDTIGAAKETHDASLIELGKTEGSLAATIRALSQLNATQIGTEGAAITQVRRRARAINSALRIGMVALAITGILLSWFTSRQHIALVESNEQLAEERAKELEMFAGRVAHDLRAPLSVIELKSTAGDRSDSVETLKAALVAIKKQGRRMVEIIDALLMFAQSGATPEPEVCPNVGDVIKEVVADVQAVASSSGIEFVVDPMRAVAAACSPRVLAIILSNLVSNATKYIGAGRGGVRRITLRMRETGARVQFEVEDTGPGLPSGKEDVVFEPFVRLSRNSDGGIGLGLATVKRLVEAHGGVVGVVSAPGTGCTFWFQLLQAPLPGTSRQPMPTPSASAAS
jgi:signal transduction histidine kinase